MANDYVMTQKVITRFLNKYGHPPLCKCCGKEITKNEPVHSVRRNRGVTKIYKRNHWEKLLH